MAFPTVATTATTNGSSAADPATINLPSGISSGDLLIMLIRVEGSTLNTPSGWDILDGSTTDASDDHTAVYYRKATGSEGSTMSFDFAASGRFAAIVYRITDAADPATTPPEIGGVGTGTSTSPRPLLLNPAGSNEDFLWLWLGGWEGEQTSPPAGTPSGFSNPIGANSGTAGSTSSNVRVASAEQQLNASFMSSPPSWTISSSDDWTAWLVAVHPVPAPTDQVATPTTLALTISLFAPTVTPSDHKTATPSTASLVLATFAPTVGLDMRAIPPALSLVLATFAPSVGVTDNQLVVPSTTALVLATFAPAVSISDHKTATPTTTSLSLATFAPVLGLRVNGAAPTALVLTPLAPDVVATTGSSEIATPSTLALVLTTFAPSLSATAHQLVTPVTASLVLATLAVSVSASDHKVVTPAITALVTELFAPTVAVVSSSALVVPDVAVLVLRTFAPDVQLGILVVAGDVLGLRGSRALRYPYLARGLRRNR